jgi:phosphohistidine phosphatase SixA
LEAHVLPNGVDAFPIVTNESPMNRHTNPYSKSFALRDVLRIPRPILLLGLLAFFASAAAGQTTIFIVRHGEKAASGGNDPDLSKAGRARAESLAAVLKDAGITAIYATEFVRTQATAAPLAKALGLEVMKSSAAETTSLATKLRNLRGGNTLVVAHSNTIPSLIKSLGIDTPVEIPDDAYDNLFVITLGEKASMIRLHYR